MRVTGTSSAQLSARELAAWRGMLATHATMIAALDAELEREHGLFAQERRVEERERRLTAQEQEARRRTGSLERRERELEEREDGLRGREQRWWNAGPAST